MKPLLKCGIKGEGGVLRELHLKEDKRTISQRQKVSLSAPYHCRKFLPSCINQKVDLITYFFLIIN